MQAVSTVLALQQFEERAGAFALLQVQANLVALWFCRMIRERGVSPRLESTLSSFCCGCSPLARGP